MQQTAANDGFTSLNLLRTRDGDRSTACDLT